MMMMGYRPGSCLVSGSDHVGSDERKGYGWWVGYVEDG